MEPVAVSPSRRWTSTPTTSSTSLTSPISQTEPHAPVTYPNIAQVRDSAPANDDADNLPLLERYPISPSSNYHGSLDYGDAIEPSTANDNFSPRPRHAPDPTEPHTNILSEPHGKSKLSPINSHNQQTSSNSSQASAVSPAPLVQELAPVSLIGDGVSGYDLTGSSSPSHKKASGGTALPIRESLGITPFFTIIGGQTLLLVLIGFLTFLWSAHGSALEAANAPPLWSRIAIRGWMIQTITLCSLVIRLVVSAQSMICTSMVAALSLEKSFVRKSQAPWFSVMRSINDGPRHLLKLIIVSRTTRVLRHTEFWLILFVAITALGLQFTSTILLSDMHDSVIVGDINPTSVNSLILYNNDTEVVSSMDELWIQLPPVYAAYGEAPSKSDVTPNAAGYSDTGVIQRGFLPLPGSRERIAVRSYVGNAIVMDSRVTCMRPRISRLRINNSDVMGGISGTLQYRSTLRDAKIDTDGLVSYPDEDFTCMLGQTTEYSTKRPERYKDYWMSSFCLLGVGRDAYTAGEETQWNMTNDPWSQDAKAWLIFATNIRKSGGHRDLLDKGRLSFEADTAGQEWASIKEPTLWALNITLCFSMYNFERNRVNMSTSGVVREPSVSWSLVNEFHDTRDVQNYLTRATSGGDLRERNILELNVLGAPDDGDPASPANSMTSFRKSISNTTMTVADLTLALLQWKFYGAHIHDPNTTFNGCHDCYIRGVTTHPEFGMLFSDIISKTGRAAVALQSFMTILATTIYENYMESLHGQQEALIAMTMHVAVPGPCSTNKCSGLISVTVLVVTHLLCTATLTALYVRRVRYSRYANVWHAVSQLVSEESRALLDEGNSASDKSVLARARSAGTDNFVKLEEAADGARVEIAGYHLPPKGPSRRNKWRLQRIGRLFKNPHGKKTHRVDGQEEHELS